MHNAKHRNKGSGGNTSVRPLTIAAPKDPPPIGADCPEGFVKQIKVIADKALDCSSMKIIVDTATRIPDSPHTLEQPYRSPTPARQTHQ